MIPVKPTEIYPTLTNIDYRCTELKLGISISFAITYYNDIGIQIDIRTVIISADEYLAWGEDDDYISAIIFNKLGLEYNMATPSGVLINLNNKYFNKVFGKGFGTVATFAESSTLDLDLIKESMLKVTPMFNVNVEGVNTWQIHDLLMNVLPSIKPTSVSQTVFIKSADITKMNYYRVKVTLYLLLYKVSFEVLEVL